MAESFRFNFGASSEPGEVPAPSASQDDVSPAREETPALEVPQDWQSEELQLPGRVLLKPSGCTVAGASTAAGITGTSDLVPGRYEGGFKLWECSVDLCQYLRTAPDAPQLKGARVLELGCGHGLPGVLAALAGASSVTWQDYNASVLHSLTAPTVVANLRAQQEAGQQQTELRFFSGDWGALHDSGMLPAQQYDVILTADTLYSPAAQPRLLALITHCLRPGGVALVAAKSFYFGVGGSVSDFAAAAAQHTLRVDTVAQLRDGASNVREIIRLTTRGGSG